MEANEVPEKIYVSNYSSGLTYNWHNERLAVNDIEYTRTDAFIEKAVKWIEEINNHHHIMRYSDSCEPSLSELTEWFKNYMKGE
jgi:hypothetical protein